ncbi:hypothetical protein B0H14DRAFT_3140501, partial [Mycena olivaceomarginata]
MTSPFLALPAELLLIILGELCDIHYYFPSRADPPYLHTRSNICRSTNGLRAISMVNQRLRNVSLCILFKISRCPSSEKFEQLSVECTTKPQFASLIRRLDVVDVDTRQLLPELLPFLTSLVRLDLNADALDAHLLAIANSHSTLSPSPYNSAFRRVLRHVREHPRSVVFQNPCLPNTILDDELSPNFNIFPLLVRRGVRFSRLTFPATSEAARQHFLTWSTLIGAVSTPLGFSLLHSATHILHDQIRGFHRWRLGLAVDPQHLGCAVRARILSCSERGWHFPVSISVCSPLRGPRIVVIAERLGRHAPRPESNKTCERDLSSEACERFHPASSFLH